MPFHLRPSGRFDSFFRSGRKVRFAASAFVFLCSIVTYLLTLEPDASFWDCPEYLVTAARLEIGHPPGNPVWTLTARIFSIFGGDDPYAIAIAVNAMSALFSALGAALLASFAFIALTLCFPRKKLSSDNALIGFVSTCGALCYAWCDSAWFSAVESEVYGMSLFLTALCMRLMAGYVIDSDRSRARRTLLLTVYLTGLSIGVHQLNLLCIPAMAMIWLFRRYRHRTGFLRLSVTLIASFAAVGFILLVMMPGTLRLASLTELLCVNSLHLPVHSGVWTFWILALTLCSLLPAISYRKGWSRRYRMLSWIPVFLLTGYSSYMLILMRGAANPPMNEGAPSDIFAMQSYLGRDQYGSTPLFYGKTPESRVMRIEKICPDGTPDYSSLAFKEKGIKYALSHYPDSADTLHAANPSPRYVSTGHFKEYVHTPELNMWFPRLTSSDPSDKESYADWAGMTQESMVPVEISYALDSCGNPVGRINPDGTRTRETELRPSYLHQLRYLGSYQIAYMYLRYLMWNFAGRQNDRFACGEIEHGNFITGIPVADNAMLGDIKRMPDEIGAANRGHNVYFLIPLLLGIIGIFALQNRGKSGERLNTIIGMLFLMTGIAIVIYLNQSPREPRERDYSFLGSFWAYAIWICAGMLALIRASRPYTSECNKTSTRRRHNMTPRLSHLTFPLALLFTASVPLWMLAQNYDDHDRSCRRGVTHFAANILNSLDKNAILFTNGDNYTFPLWWAQEVAGIRRDVTVINTAYLATPWYVTSFMIPGPESTPLLMQAKAADVAFGDAAATFYTRSAVSPSHIDSLTAEDALLALRRRYDGGQSIRFPAMLRIVNPHGNDSLYIRTSAIASGASTIGLRQLAAFDIIASNAASSNPRPVYWFAILPSSDFAGTYPITSRTLFTRRLVYTDTMTPALKNQLLDRDLLQARRNLPGKTSLNTSINADASFGPMITAQRYSLLRLGGRLLDAGRYRDALDLAKIIDARYPASDWEYQLFVDSDSACHEGLDLAVLFLEGAKGCGNADSNDYQKGLTLLHRERNRLAQWRDYYLSLSPQRRRVLTPKSKAKAKSVTIADSLILKYESHTIK